MLGAVLGVTLTAVLVVMFRQHRGWHWHPANLGAMSQSWVASYNASQPASPN